MKISKISVFAKELPLQKTQYLSKGRVFNAFGATFVKIETDTGLVGWGEVTPWGSNYLAAFPGGLRHAVCDMAPALIGEDPLNPEAIYRIMDHELAGHYYAKAAIDFAIWDIVGRASGRPIYDVLGGAQNEAPHISASLHLNPPEAMLAERDAYRKMGVRTFSVKMGQGIQTDIKVIDRFQETRLPEETYVFDANGGLSPKDAITILNRTKTRDYIFEQPCQTYETSLAVSQKVSQGISLDECLTDIYSIVRAINDGGCVSVNIKLARVGGYTKARQIRDLLLAYDMNMYIMCMGGTALSDTISAQFARTVPADRLVGTWASQVFLKEDLFPGQGARPQQDGTMSSSNAPGLGFEVDETGLGAPIAVFQ